MKKAIYIILAVIGILSISGYMYVSSGPYPSEGAEVAISKALAIGHTSIEVGETGFVNNQGVSIWYEHIVPTDSAKGTVLLVMGHSTTGINFSDYFYQPIVDAGYAVIIYDNRGVGRSDWIDDWSKKNAFDLEDMASDGIAILDHLKIERAHVAGVSMGGMIAQHMAISYPDRVLSLGSIMTSGFMMDPEIEPVDPKFESNMLKLGLRYFVRPNEVNYMRFSMVIADELKGKGDYKHDLDRIANRTLFELRDRKGFNPKVGTQHSVAIELSGSRYDALKQLQLPTIAIHGTDDPLVFPDHAKKYVPLIPNAEMLWIDGMGHDIPEAYAPKIVAGLIRNFERA